LRRIAVRRIGAIHRTLAPDEPMRLGLYTRARSPSSQAAAFQFDWQPAFNGRAATQETWNGRLLPALREVADLLRIHAPGRRIEAEGLTSVPAALALGSAFLQVR